MEQRDRSIVIISSITPKNTAKCHHNCKIDSEQSLSRESRDELADRIQNLESLIQRYSPPSNNSVRPDLCDFDYTRSANRRQLTNNVYSNDWAKREDFWYSSIGAISQLPRDRIHDDALRANIRGLSKSFTHPNTKFFGDSDLAKNHGANHQSSWM